MAIDWPDVIKVAGGFVGGILTLWLAEAIRDQYKTRADQRAAIYTKRKEIIEALMPLIHDACVSVSLYVTTRGVRSDDGGQVSGAIAALSQFVALNKPYFPPDLTAMLEQIADKLAKTVGQISAFQISAIMHYDSFGHLDAEKDAEGIKILQEATTLIDTEIPAMRASIERRFRTMLGVPS